MTPEQRIRWIYDSKDQQDLSQRYDDWANDYDEHLEGGLDYVAPAIGVELLSKWLTKNARILDVGAGTGLVGQRLFAAGYRNLVALDNSPGMLEQARKKGVYRELSRQDLHEPLTFESSSFDAAIAIGAFTFGHISASAFNELIRITRGGGIIVFSVLKDFYEHGRFRDDLRHLELAGMWTLIEAGEPFGSRKNVDSEATGLAFAYEVS